MSWREDNDNCADLDPIVEIDRILIGHADAARGDGLADIFGLVGAVDTILACPCRQNTDIAHALPSDFAARQSRKTAGAQASRVRRRSVSTTAILPLRPTVAMPLRGSSVFADGDAVPDRLALRQDEVKKLVAGMLGPNGDLNGCVSFKNYDAFLQAYLDQKIKLGW